MTLSQQEVTSMREALRPLAKAQNGLLPALHLLQREHGYINPSFHLLLADVFNLTQAEIKGVVSFYHDFREKPHGKHLLRLCQAEACQSVGARDITAFVKDLTGLDLGETSQDENLTVEAVYCLGLCAAGPAADLDGVPIARLDDAKVSELVASVSKDISS